MNTKPTSESPAARLLAELEAGAELIDEGAFSLNAARAMDKLGSLALAEPEAWTVMLVEVAALLGAPTVAFEFDARGARAWVFAPGLTRPQLDALSSWTTNVGAPDDPRELARRQLTLAYLTLLAQQPSSIQIVSAAGRGRQPCQLTHDGERERVEALLLDEHPPAGLKLDVHFDQRDRDRARRARELLMDRCRYSRLNVVVDKIRVSHDHAMFLDAARFVQNIELDGQAIGVAGVGGAEQRALLRIQINEVSIETVEVEAEPGFRAIVEAKLERDLSQTKVTRNPSFDALIEAVKVAAEATTAERGRRRQEHHAKRDTALARIRERDLVRNESSKNDLLSLTALLSGVALIVALLLPLPIGSTLLLILGAVAAMGFALLRTPTD